MPSKSAALKPPRYSMTLATRARSCAIVCSLSGCDGGSREVGAAHAEQPVRVDAGGACAVGEAAPGRSARRRRKGLVRAEIAAELQRVDGLPAEQVLVGRPPGDAIGRVELVPDHVA